MNRKADSVSPFELGLLVSFGRDHQDITRVVKFRLDVETRSQQLGSIGRKGRGDLSCTLIKISETGGEPNRIFGPMNSGTASEVTLGNRGSRGSGRGWRHEVKRKVLTVIATPASVD